MPQEDLRKKGAGWIEIGSGLSGNPDMMEILEKTRKGSFLNGKVDDFIILLERVSCVARRESVCGSDGCYLYNS